MRLPSYWLTRPSAGFDKNAQAAFDTLLKESLTLGVCPTIRYDLPWPKWQFLCYLAEQQHVVLHGSGEPSIAQFEPRQPIDISAFGGQNAVYAAADGIWAMFFAIVDRERVPSVSNACMKIVDATRTVSGPFYVFSISQSALPNQPWRTGMVYLLPRSTFTAQAPITMGPNEVRIAQLASFVSVRPLAKLEIAPADFPFLKQIRGHDDARLHEYATAMQTGAPWPDDL